MIKISECESIGTLIEDVFQVVAKNQIVGDLPRPLRVGEFYCHRCREFVAMEKSAEHGRLHGLQGKGVAQ